MEWFIIGFIMLSLVGSAMWMMPTPRERFLAKLRMQARSHGFAVQIKRVEFPRAKGEMEAETLTLSGYKMLREQPLEFDEFPALQLFRITAMANDGLPEGWSWKFGEGVLDQQQLATLQQAISELPADVLGLEISADQVSAYWRETDEQDLPRLAAVVQQLMKV